MAGGVSAGNARRLPGAGMGEKVRRRWRVWGIPVGVSLVLVLGFLLLWWPWAPPTDAKEEGPCGGQFQPFTFIHAGDPQMGKIGTIQEVKGRFVQLARRANELHPAFVLIAGDLVDTGDNAAQLAARDEALREFRVPVKLFADRGVRFVLCGHTHRTTQTEGPGFTVYTVAGTALAGDKRGFGYRLFRVSEGGVEQKYFTLDVPVEEVKGAFSQPAVP